ncbi:aquaporin-9-like [Bolinopsis microptera]|uniref:aquaporin-9-like n=1 Tax=Bolinopsis microptera TaxID=2820187 RepID=UPI0030797562
MLTTPKGLGDGAIAQYVFLNKNAKDSEPFSSIFFGWGCAVMFGVYLAEGISGAHMNPAVTIAFAVVKKFEWRKVPKYIFAQMFGGFFGGLLVFVQYFDRLVISGELVLEDHYRGIFATYPHPDTSVGGRVVDQLVTPFLLLLIVSCLVDQKNKSAPPPGVTPILVGCSVLSIGLSFGINTGIPLNPARDLAPRVMTAILGYDHVFSAFDYYCWIPVICPIVGATLGAGTYVLLIEQPNSKLTFYDLNNGDSLCIKTEEKADTKNEAVVEEMVNMLPA